MNPLAGRPVEDAGQMAIDLGPLGRTPVFGTEQAAALRQAKAEAIYGFRPEQSALEGEGQGMAMPVNLVERIGARTILHLGKDRDAAKVEFENDAGFETGKMLCFAPLTASVRLFNAASGTALRGI
jgi:multiple sugar transport system ATP-binding protein